MPTENHEFFHRDKPKVTVAKRFNLKHIFRSGAIVWVKHQGRDYYLVFKSISRPSRGFQIPGGRIEKYENPSDTIVREVYEETGLETRIVCPLGMMMLENTVDNYSNMQIYYILKPVNPINITEKWRFIDHDNTKQELECWFVPVDKDPSFLSAGQHNTILMFRDWLHDHQKAKPKVFVPFNKTKVANPQVALA
jgi:8-oxo-dGTP pyrophosphatase MutT (NUDIX family)